ncbi:hypothetical protein HK100_003311 [Physocladia obscura]|uniref:Uncharacterized protein n=1 Tax=Physocladia obscura TaxID=109957 RepID=A0AAD5XAJ0_9FUNG|nr:hypothetical protein HK100_003311 [Physocladia obscura]
MLELSPNALCPVCRHRILSSLRRNAGKLVDFALLDRLELESDNLIQITGINVNESASESESRNNHNSNSNNNENNTENNIDGTIKNIGINNENSIPLHTKNSIATPDSVSVVNRRRRTTRVSNALSLHALPPQQPPIKNGTQKNKTASHHHRFDPETAANIPDSPRRSSRLHSDLQRYIPPQISPSRSRSKSESETAVSTPKKNRQAHESATPSAVITGGRHSMQRRSSKLNVRLSTSSNSTDDSLGSVKVKEININDYDHDHYRHDHNNIAAKKWEEEEEVQEEKFTRVTRSITKEMAPIATRLRTRKVSK